MSNDAIERGQETITSVIFVSILLGVALLALVITLGALSQASRDANGAVYETLTVANESGYVNATGYTLVGAGVADTDQYTITLVLNATDNTTIGAGNYSLSAAGVLTNATVANWDEALVSYTYRRDKTEEVGVDVGITGIKTNVVAMIANFFAMMPTIGTILAVVLLIAVIVILIIYVSRMRNSGQSASTFAG